MGELLEAYTRFVYFVIIMIIIPIIFLGIKKLIYILDFDDDYNINYKSKKQNNFLKNIIKRIKEWW